MPHFDPPSSNEKTQDWSPPDAHFWVGPLLFGLTLIVTALMVIL